MIINSQISNTFFYEGLLLLHTFATHFFYFGKWIVTIILYLLWWLTTSQCWGHCWLPYFSLFRFFFHIPGFHSVICFYIASSRSSARGQDTVPRGVCALSEVRHDCVQAGAHCGKCHWVCCQVFHKFPVSAQNGRGGRKEWGRGGRWWWGGWSSLSEFHLQLPVGGIYTNSYS